jgi:hypothetical protein
MLSGTGSPLLEFIIEPAGVWRHATMRLLWRWKRGRPWAASNRLMMNEQVSAARQDDQRGNTPQQDNRHFLLLAFSRLPLSSEALSQLRVSSSVPQFPR